jgi:hypothetical protein
MLVRRWGPFLFPTSVHCCWMITTAEKMSWRWCWWWLMIWTLVGAHEIFWWWQTSRYLWFSGTGTWENFSIWSTWLIFVNSEIVFWLIFVYAACCCIYLCMPLSTSRLVILAHCLSLHSEIVIKQVNCLLEAVDCMCVLNFQFRKFSKYYFGVDFYFCRVYSLIL